MNLRSILPLLLVLGACNAPDGGEVSGAEAARHPDALSYPQVQRFLFFAVLEGLYEDGYDTETARAIAALEGEAGVPKNFVNGCPICIQALSAFQLYALRPSFYGEKQGQDTFGPGVGPALRERLHSEDAAERGEAIRGVVEDFVQRRLERSRFSEVQRASLAQYLRQMKKKGMAILMEYQQDDAPEDYLDLYREWSACPSCDGANAAEF